MDSALIDTDEYNTLLASSLTEDGYRLLDNGGCVADQDYRLVKYRLSTGPYRLISKHKAQFQSGHYVPTSTNGNLIYQFNAFVGNVAVPNGADYIIISKPISDTTSGLYGIRLQDVIVWPNVANGGIYISGNSIIVNNNGFSVYTKQDVYYVAPTDMTSLTTFTGTSNANQLLILNKTALTNAKGRNNPSSVLSVYTINTSTINLSTDYIVVALWYKNKWKFVKDFDYYNKVTVDDISADAFSYIDGRIEDAKPRSMDVVIWNVSSGGIYIDGADIKTNENGFGVVYKQRYYYVAPVDRTTNYTFSPVSTTCYLVLDTEALINENSRNEPNSVLTVVDYYDIGSLDNNRYLIVANYYKSGWKFVGAFEYFNNYKLLQPPIKYPASAIFSETHLIAHKGGNTKEANTIANCEDAISNGYKMIEVDVVFTSDSVPVLSHDLSITINGTTYVIADYTYSQLITMKPNLAKLSDFLILCKRNNIVAEIDFTKTYTNSQTDILGTLLIDMGMTGRAMVTCYEATARRLMTISNNFIVCVSGITESKLASISDIIEGTLVTLGSVQDSDFTSQLLSTAHAAGVLIKVWTVNTVADANTIFDAGADYIISDSVKPSDLRV